MTTATAAIQADAAPTGGMKKRFKISLRFKLAFATVGLITGVMSAVGYSLYVQQRAALTREVLERGRTIIQGAETGAREALLQASPDELSIYVLVRKSVQPADAPIMSEHYEFNSFADMSGGLKKAFTALADEVPAQLSAWLHEKGWGGSPLPPSTHKAIQNEGVFEMIVVDPNGVIRGHSKGTEASGQTYEAPRYVEQASPETPYPVYEQDWFDETNTRRVRLLFDVQKDIVEPSSEKKLGVIHLGLSQGLIQRVVFDSAMRLIAITLASLVLGLVFTYFLVSVMVRPVGKLVTGVLAIAGGNFEFRVKHKSRDELGELTTAFNTMAKSLEDNKTLQGAFTRYVSDAALKQILSDPSKGGIHSRLARVTVYTSDVRGFTSMSESLQPEMVVQIINTYLSLQTEIILKHGGVVDKFIGDATVGVWGKEEEKPDDAIAAVRAAFEVQQAIAKMNQEREAKGETAKLVGIGINSGEAVAGNLGSSTKLEYTTAGENVILADKVCAECPGGLVWISESTYQLVKDQVVVEIREPLKLKGREQPFAIYEVTGLK